jgi:hypothetical protein
MYDDIGGHFSVHQSAYFVLFDYNKAEEQSPTGCVDVSNQHLPSLLYSSSVNINHLAVFSTMNKTVYRVVR